MNDTKAEGAARIQMQFGIDVEMGRYDLNMKYNTFIVDR